MRINCRLLIVGLVVAGAGCFRAPDVRTYQLKGQILTIRAATNELLVKHEDIPGFMPAMTMSYQVRDPALLEDKKPGDLITATLVVEEVSGYLSTMTVTGNAAIKNAGAGPAITSLQIAKAARCGDSSCRPSRPASFNGAADPALGCG